MCLFYLYLGDETKLQVLTVATSETDGYQRFMRSVRLLDLDVEVSLGMSAFQHISI